MSCFSQDSTLFYDSESEKWGLSFETYKQLRINEGILLNSLRAEETPWALLETQFPDEYSTRTDTTFIETLRTDNLDGLRVFYTNYEDSKKLRASRLEIDSKKFFLSTYLFELRIGTPINGLFPNTDKALYSNRNFIVLYPRTSSNKYRSAPAIGLSLDSETKKITKITVTFWSL